MISMSESSLSFPSPFPFLLPFLCQTNKQKIRYRTKVAGTYVRVNTSPRENLGPWAHQEEMIRCVPVAANVTAFKQHSSLQIVRCAGS